MTDRAQGQRGHQPASKGARIGIARQVIVRHARTAETAPTSGHARSRCRPAEVVADVEAEWTAHLGERRMADLRRTLTPLREITDPYMSAAVSAGPDIRRVGVRGQRHLA